MFKHKCRIAKTLEHFSKMKVFELLNPVIGELQVF